jgi:hypothetical protein
MDPEMLRNRGSSSRDFRKTAVILLVGNLLVLIGFQLLRGGSSYDSM